MSVTRIDGPKVIEVEIGFHVIANCRNATGVHFIMMHRFRQAGAPVIGWFPPQFTRGDLTQLPVMGPLMRWRWTDELHAS